MKTWRDVQIKSDAGEIVKAVSPLIISASRSTDIPAFHADWLINRLKKGHVIWVSPFDRKPHFVSFQDARLFVFWTKNPEPLIRHLPVLEELGLNYYFQYTLNDYGKEGFEPKVPSLQRRIETFISLSEKIGKEKVIWRFDPLLLTEKLTVEELLLRISNIGNLLIKHTDKLVFSFADILAYRKVKSNLLNETSFFSKLDIHLAEFNTTQKIEFACGIQKILNEWRKVNQDIQVATCAEDIDLGEYEIVHNKCIDDVLIAKLFGHDNKLMDFHGIRPNELLLFSEDVQAKKSNLKDKGQRKVCGCIMSKDIGSYNTCSHLCVYCYANTSPFEVYKNIGSLKPDSESILP